jgi:hypothetical protein
MVWASGGLNANDAICVVGGDIDRGREPRNRGCKVAIQTNNVDVDDYGYIYIVDGANTGMHILELTGSARQVADLP